MLCHREPGQRERTQHGLHSDQASNTAKRIASFRRLMPIESFAGMIASGQDASIPPHPDAARRRSLS